MGTYINKGNEGFQRALNSDYVDKTGMIAVINKTLNTERAFSCVTRCRRFGKTIAVDMLRAYYDKSCDSRSLFNGLKITSDPSFEKHLNKYAVISLDITDFTTRYKDDPNITSVKQYAVNITITLSAGPSQATNGVIAISSSNAAVAEIRANNNAKLIAEGAYELEAGELAIHTEDNGVAKIVVTAKTAGTATIVARSLAGTARAECVINVKNGEIQVKTTPAPENLTDTINASNDPTMHTHQYTAMVVQPTPYEKGYTIYTCSCGHSYIDNYTSPLPMPTPEATPHVHHYTASVVAPTATERGYTLHVCQECGDSYKDAYVAPTGG